MYSSLWVVIECAEGYFLQEQARAVKEVSVYVSMLRRVGKVGSLLVLTPQLRACTALGKTSVFRALDP